MGWIHSQETMVWSIDVVLVFGHVSKPDCIWSHRQLKKKENDIRNYQKQNQAQSDPLYRHYLFEIVFWILIFPFSLLFQRNSRSESEYFPLFQTFSRNCTLTSPTEGLLLQDLR